MERPDFYALIELQKAEIERLRAGLKKYVHCCHGQYTCNCTEAAKDALAGRPLKT